MAIKQKQQIIIHNEMDVLRSRKIGTAMAAKMGFSDIDCAEIEIVISELGTNIIKHAESNGELFFYVSHDQKSDFLEIMAIDYGQQNTKISEVDFFQDGISSKGSLGIGLSGVRRMVDEFDIKFKDDTGVHITVKKRLQNRKINTIKCSAFSCPKFGEKSSGDGFWLKHLHDGVFFCLIDTLGHGEEAHEVTKIALAVIENNYQNSMIDIIEKCHIHLKGKRGAAIALGRIDIQKNIFKHISVGNIETRIYSSVKTKNPFYFNGTVGLIYRNIYESQYQFCEDSCIVMYSDGISSKFELDALSLRKSAQEIAHHIFKNFVRKHDDATVLVLK